MQQNILHGIYSANQIARLPPILMELGNTKANKYFLKLTNSVKRKEDKYKEISNKNRELEESVEFRIRTKLLIVLVVVLFVPHK